MIDKLDLQFKEKMIKTDAYLNCPKFKQNLLVKPSNITNMRNFYDQANRYGIEYLKQNPNLSGMDVKIVEEVINLNNTL